MTRPLTRLGVLAVLMTALASTALAVPPDFMDRLADDARPAEDKARDGARRPYQVMRLLDVQPGMTVVDVAAGAGWYTEVLSAAVGPDGTVISQFGTPESDDRRERAERLGNVEPVFDGLEAIEQGTADRAMTALSLHHRDASFLREIHDLLKPGGMAAVIDHAGSPGMDNDALHRMLKDDAQAMIEEAGLEIVDDSDLLRTSADDHTLSIRAPELARNTDRFLFVVRRPETR